MMGGFSAKMGSDDRGYEEIMGEHWLGEMNDSDEEFAFLCALNNLVMGRCVFQYKGYTKQFT